LLRKQSYCFYKWSHFVCPQSTVQSNAENKEKSLLSENAQKNCNHGLFHTITAVHILELRKPRLDENLVI